MIYILRREDCGDKALFFLVDKNDSGMSSHVFQSA